MKRYFLILELIKWIDLSLRFSESVWKSQIVKKEQYRVLEHCCINKKTILLVNWPSFWLSILKVSFCNVIKYACSCCKILQTNLCEVFLLTESDSTNCWTQWHIAAISFKADSEVIWLKLLVLPNIAVF